MRVLPANGQGLVDLHILAGFDAAATKDALARIVTLKRICRIDFVGLRLERNLLMLDGKEPGGVMNRAGAVIIVTHGAIEQVIAQNLIESFSLGSNRAGRFR